VCEHALAERDAFLVIDGTAARIHLHEQHTIGLVANRQFLHVAEAAQEQRGADEQCHGKCTLYDQQRTASTGMMMRAEPCA
jgi:hypothetical protein